MILKKISIHSFCDNYKREKITQYEYNVGSFAFELYDSKKNPVNISECISAVYYGTKADGKLIGNECEIADNKVIITPTLQMTACVGLLKGIIECQFKSGNIRFYGIDFEILPAPEKAEIASTDEFTVFDRTLAEVREILAKAENGEFNGADGIGITNAEISTDGKLILTYSNGTSKNLGTVVDTNAYTKTEIDTALATKADKDNLSSVIPIKNRVIEFVTGYYPWNHSYVIDFKASDNVNYAKVSVDGGKTYSANNLNIADAFSFFTDAENKIVAQMSSSYKNTTDGYVFTVPDGAVFAYLGATAGNMTSLVVLETDVNISPTGLKYTVNDYPYNSEPEYVKITNLVSQVGEKNIFDTVAVNKSNIENLKNKIYSISLNWEIGGIGSSKGTLATNLARARTDLFHPSKPTVISSVDDGWKIAVAKYDENGNFVSWIAPAAYQVVNTSYYRLVAFPVTGLTDVTDYLDEIKSNIVAKNYVQTYTVAQDGSGDFTDVQTALDFAQFAQKTFPVTLLIYPGTYDKISTLTQKKYIDNIPTDNIKWYNRYVSLIGVNQNTCIIQSDSGEYYTPAAEINITGLVKNLTFISTHNAPPDNAENATHKAYAVHSDYGKEDCQYEDCTFISYQAPAVGIGGAKDKHIRFRNCHMYSYAPLEGDYSGLVNFGGLFYHLMAGDGITGQIFEMENCVVYSQNGDKAVWITVSSATNYEQETHLRNNCFYGDTCGKTVLIDSAMLSADCYGNNVESANAS